MKIALNPKMLLSGELSFTSLTFILKQKAISYNVSNINKLTRKSSFWSKDTGGDKKSSDKTYEIIDPLQLKCLDDQNLKIQKIVQSVPGHIKLPEYALTAVPYQRPGDSQLNVWNEDEIIRIRKSCRIAKYIVRALGNTISSFSSNKNNIQYKSQPKYQDLSKIANLTTNDLNKQAHEMILSANSYPSTLNFNGFPKSIATSVNNIVAHGIPDDRPLKDGDILSVDVTVYHDGFHGDCAETFVVGDMCDLEGRHLVNSAKECLFAGIAACAPGAPIRAIGSSISKFSKRRGVKAVPTLCGHGIGSHFHMGQDIYHVPTHILGVMIPGNIFTIEPHITEGYTGIEIKSEDGFNIATKDHSRAAYFEHTVLITERGVDVLTL